ncbi:hypothetical protein GGI11_008469, partial [Coemansia sp. RSA 2049]
MDAAMVAKMTLDESASESRHPQQQDDTYVQETSSPSSPTSSYSATSSEMSSDSEHGGSKSAPPAGTRGHTRSSPFLRSDRQQPPQQATGSTSSYSASSEVSSDGEHRGSGSAPPTNTRSHTRLSPFLRSDRQLQKTSESPARPAAASGYTHDAGGLRRSSRKRAQRELLDTQSQPLSPSPPPPPLPPPTAPVLRSSTRSRSGNRRQASGGGGGGGGSGARPKSTGTGTGTSADQRRTSRSATSSQQQQQQQQNKRRHTSGAKKSQAIGGSSSSSSRDSGTDVVISGDGDAVNAHIDQCLARSAGESPSNELDGNDNGHADGGNGEGSMMVAYEWDGQIRIRATAMLEGG